LGVAVFHVFSGLLSNLTFFLGVLGVDANGLADGDLMAGLGVMARGMVYAV
jgi:hypothetical protein